MIVFDREGKFLRTWDDDIFERAHGLHIGPNDMLYRSQGRRRMARRAGTSIAVAPFVVALRPGKWHGPIGFISSVHQRSGRRWKAKGSNL